jgi:leucyl/phenylalanyl-tRNA--protein transferase
MALPTDAPRLSPELILRAYRVGLFPMAEKADGDQLYWFDPLDRGVLPLESFHVPRRLLRTVKSRTYRVTVDSDFTGVITGCAAASESRRQTWINRDIVEAYTALFARGFAHSVEVWQNERLVGGLYGVSIGAAFFGESMFSFARDASKVALVHLVARLRAGGFRLLDTQFGTAHLAQFGCVEIPREDYHRRLQLAVEARADFHCGDEESVIAGFLQSTTQIS